MAGRSGDLSTTQLWSALMLVTPGTYAVCWCAGTGPMSGLTCTADGSFNILAGVFNVLGPEAARVISAKNAEVNKPFALEIFGTGLARGDRIRVLDLTRQCGGPGASRNTEDLVSGPMAENPDVEPVVTHRTTNSTEFWEPLTISKTGEYRVCWCAVLGSNCQENSEFAVDAGTFQVVDKSSGGAWMKQKSKACNDLEGWRSIYGEDCAWYLQHDPGCTKYADLGQLAGCPASCNNCEGDRPKPDLRRTSCPLGELCACFDGCETPAPCPAGSLADGPQGEEADCEVELLEATKMQRSDNMTEEERRRGANFATPFVQLSFVEMEREVELLGLETTGDPTTHHHTKVFSVAVSTDGRTFVDVDGGRKFSANWDGEHEVRSFFSRPEAKVGYVRVLMDEYVGSPTISASLIAKTCKSQSPEERERAELEGDSGLECRQLKCMARCFNLLGCEGDFVRYCEDRKESAAQARCDVDCSSAVKRFSEQAAKGVLLLFSLLPVLVGAQTLLVLRI